MERSIGWENIIHITDTGTDYTDVLGNLRWLFEASLSDKLNFMSAERP